MRIFDLIWWVLHGHRKPECRQEPMTTAEAEAIVEQAAASAGEPLDVKTSIVDVMKALGLDSGLPARKQLAAELGYRGALDGSAAMNTWLRDQVLDRVRDRTVDTLQS